MRFYSVQGRRTRQNVTRYPHGMNSRHGNVIRITVSFWRESTGHPYIPSKKASNAGLSWFSRCGLELAVKLTVKWFKTPWFSCDVTLKIHWAPRCWHGFTWTPLWMCNHMFSKEWDEITYPLPNLNDTSVGVLECMNNFISHSVTDAIAYPCWDLKLNLVNKRGPGWCTDQSIVLHNIG